MARWSPWRRRRTTEYREERAAAPPRPKPFWPWLLLLLLLVLGALGASWYFANRGETVDAAEVPNVVGAQRAEAERRLEEREFEATAQATLEGAGFAVRVADQPTTSAEQDGIVVRQAPAGGGSTRTGSTVTIFVGRLS
jgi:beta-lactam-binding protein with PASTA domain